MNFSKINYKSFLGRILRLPLRLIPKRMVLPILQGRLRGLRWVVGAGEHGYWLGSYEMSKRTAFEKEITTGTVVYDIGANVGYFSLLSSVLSGEEGQIYAFEPLPRNLAFLKKHIALNKLSNIQIIEAAVSSHTGEALFEMGASSAMGHLSDEGGLQVKLVALDEMVLNGQIQPPDYMKIDVEGAEYDVLRGAERTITKYQPVMFLDTHQREAHKNTIRFLEQHDYVFEVLDGKPLPETKELIARHKNKLI